MCTSSVAPAPMQCTPRSRWSLGPSPRAPARAAPVGPGRGEGAAPGGGPAPGGKGARVVEGALPGRGGDPALPGGPRHKVDRLHRLAEPERDVPGAHLVE